MCNVALLSEEGSQIGVGLHVIRIDADGLAETCFSQIELFIPDVGNPQIVVRTGIIGKSFDECEIFGSGETVETALLEEGGESKLRFVLVAVA